MALSSTKHKVHEYLTRGAFRYRTFMDKFPKIHNVYFVAIISCLSGLMFGFDISSMSAFVGEGPYKRFFHSPNSVMQGFITSAMPLGSFVGSLLTSYVSEPFGRRASLSTCSFFWMVGAAVQSLSQNRTQLIFGRIISGLGIGFGSSVAPLYCTEISPRKVRGFVGGIFQQSCTVGITVMFYIAYGCSQIKGVASFRIAWAIQIIPGLVLFFGIFLIPESPRWLAKKDLWEEAEAVVARIQGNKPGAEAEVLLEMQEIRQQLEEEASAKDFTYAMLFSKKYLPRTMVAFWAQTWQQFTGVNVNMYYVVYIFQMAGYSGNSNLISSSIQYVLNMVCTFPALFLMDRVGRRIIFLVGACFMMAFQFAIGGLLGSYSQPWADSGNPTVTIKIPDDKKPAARAVIACCYLFVCSFAMSWGVVTWVYAAELWGDTRSRQRGAAVSTAANWIFNFAIGMFTPLSFQNINWRTYFIYGSCCCAMFFHVFFFFPETKGKTLEEIDQIWESKVPAWKLANFKTHVLGGDLEKTHAEHIETGSGSDEMSLMKTSEQRIE